MAKQHAYDITILGGGLAGLTLACLLGPLGLKIACIDQNDPNAKPKDERTTAISYGSRKILERAGIWEHLNAPCAIRDIQILDGNSPVLLEFLSADTQADAFGWIADNAALRGAMLTTLKNFKNIELIAPARIANFETHKEGVCLIFDNGKFADTKLVVGADGRNSSVRKFLEETDNLETRSWSYNQRAVICMVSHDNTHENVAVEHFWPEGPFAILPAADDEKGQHRSSVVFTEHGPEKDSLMHMNDQEFEAALAARFPERYGAVKVLGNRASYPLGLVHAARYIGPKTDPKMVLIADAAHGIHPIAGQGLNLGFRDIDALSNLIEQAVNAGQSFASKDVLESYQRQRRIDNMAMVAMTDGLNRLFSNNLKSVTALRRLGLRAVSKLRPAKKFFMKQAMGDR